MGCRAFTETNLDPGCSRRTRGLRPCKGLLSASELELEPLIGYETKAYGPVWVVGLKLRSHEMSKASVRGST